MYERETSFLLQGKLSDFIQASWYFSFYWCSASVGGAQAHAYKQRFCKVQRSARSSQFECGLRMHSNHSVIYVMEKKNQSKATQRKKNKKSLNAQRWLVEPSAGGHTIGDLHPCTRLDPFIRIAQVRRRFYSWFFFWWAIDIRRVPSERWRLLLIQYIFYTNVCATRCWFHSILLLCWFPWLSDAAVAAVAATTANAAATVVLYGEWMQFNRIIINQASSCTTRRVVQQEKT